MSQSSVTAVGNIISSRVNGKPLSAKPTHACNQLLIVMWAAGQRQGNTGIQQQVVRCLGRQTRLETELKEFIQEQAVRFVHHCTQVNLDRMNAVGVPKLLAVDRKSVV